MEVKTILNILRQKLANILKNNLIMYKIYYYIGTLLVNILKFFIKTDPKLILFVSYGGKQYSDSPKVIYESMIKDPRFKEFKFVWALKKPEEFNVPGDANIIKIDTLKYYLISLKARCWITNVVIERTLNYSGKNTFYFCTWHGTPIKTIGYDVDRVTFYNHFKYKFDVMIAQGEYDKNIFKSAFNLSDDQILNIGIPRNDVLITSDLTIQRKVRNKLNIPANKKVILYAPTYRDGQAFTMNEIINVKKWKKTLGDEYVLLFRSHSAVIKRLNIEEDKDFLFDVSDYQELNDLMIASDMLISDYSSIFFDYSLLGKPIYCYAEDYEDYIAERSVYFDIRKELPGGSCDEDELLNLIQSESNDDVLKKVRVFKENYLQYYGEATKKSLDTIYNNII